MKKRTETIIEDSFAKKIAKVETETDVFIEKTYYQHENAYVYEVLRRFPHPNICKILNVAYEEDYFIVSEEYLGAQTLFDVVPITNMHLLYKYLNQICEALKHLHAHNLVHRDLKPENIFIVNGNVILNDFDISKEASNSPKRRDTQILGSVGFASPEQYGFSRSDARSDIYSLGIVINMMATGNFISEDYVRGPLSYIVDQCIEMNPSDRYQTVDQVQEAIQLCENGKSRYAFPGFRKGKNRNRILAILGYSFIAYLVFTVKPSIRESIADDIAVKLFTAYIMFSLIFIPLNYMNMRKYLPMSIRKYKIVSSLILFCFGLSLVFLVSLALYGIVGIML